MSFALFTPRAPRLAGLGLDLDPLEVGGAELVFHLTPQGFGFYHVEMTWQGRVVYASDGYKPNPNVPQHRWRNCLVGFAIYDAQRGTLPLDQAAWWKRYGEEAEMLTEDE